jgi:hypothetical protein
VCLRGGPGSVAIVARCHFFSMYPPSAVYSPSAVPPTSRGAKLLLAGGESYGLGSPVIFFGDGLSNSGVSFVVFAAGA